MAVKDIRSDLKQTLVMASAISTDTTTAGAILDTADFELGLMFAVAVSLFTDGSFELLIEESSDPAMSGAVAVTGDKLIGALPVVAAANSPGDVLPSVGVISNLRYVRASIVSTGVTTGATLTLLGTEKGEYKPVNP